MPDRIPKVLYIDDDEGLRRLVEKDLQRAGYIVETATGGTDGMRRLREQTFDLVALDHHMPEETGLELLAKIVVSPATTFSCSACVASGPIFARKLGRSQPPTSQAKPCARVSTVGEGSSVP